MPVNVFDVARFILKKQGRMTTWKLQKLCYYSQAWSLVWDETPLFREPIEAWANGPVIPALYERHKGTFYIQSLRVGNPAKLDDTQKDTVNAIIEAYGKKTAQWLSDLTHREGPWKNARRREGLEPGERGNAVISLDDIADYYGGLYAEEER